MLVLRFILNVCESVTDVEMQSIKKELALANKSWKEVRSMSVKNTVSDAL